MASSFLNRRDMNFMLYEFLDAERLTRFPRYKEHSKETFDAILDVAEQISLAKFHPHNAKGDQHEPVLVDGKVAIIPEVGEAIAAFAEAGFFAAAHGTDLGGIALPFLLGQASTAFFMAANAGTSGYPFLTIAAGNLIEAFGTEEQKTLFLPPMLDGRFFGTMALTEAQAGSSLADIVTSAEPTREGDYLIKGNKVFISGGEHELSENIVHLVLARIKGAPPGVKGISLFIVPRYRVNSDGSAGEANDVALAGLIHKMGYRGTTSTMLNFGENDRCIGYLVGETHKGLNCMFHMMNEARIGVGMCATALGYAGYLYSLDYARNRPQGRLPTGKAPLSKQVMIIEHPDVRRMLLMQKAYVEGSLALGLYVASLVDVQRGSEAEAERTEAGLLLDILTPIAKGWSSQFCLEANSQAIQILGGYGFTRDYPVEQYYRDNRLNPIHEGTNGIQGIDLLGRKITIHDGAAFRLLCGEMEATIGRAGAEGSLLEWAGELGEALTVVRQTTGALLAAREQADVELFLANASLYLEMLGHLVIAWIWLRQAQVATERLDGASELNRNFYQGKLQACRYFYRWELPKISYQSTILSSLDPTCHSMQECWF